MDLKVSHWALVLLGGTFLVGSAGAQAFSPSMPEGVPAVTGAVTDAAVLRYIDVMPGTGDPARPGQQYRVHYTGWLRDGTKFDSSRDRNEPFEFIQGRRLVIAGWESGFEGMKVGGKRRLFLPYQLAYGERGSGTIPPKAELIFDVELLGVRDVPEFQPASEVLAPLSGAAEKIVSLAKAIPEDQLDWRPQPGVRSFREVLLHIALDNRLFLDAMGGKKTSAELTKMVEENSKAEKIATSQAQIAKLLEEGFAAIRKEAEPMRNGQLSATVDFFGSPMTVRGVLIVLTGHAQEHLGQLIAYSRMNRIVPPWSKGEAR